MRQNANDINRKRKRERKETSHKACSHCEYSYGIMNRMEIDLTLIIATVFEVRQIDYNVIIVDVFGSSHCDQRKFILKSWITKISVFHWNNSDAVVISAIELPFPILYLEHQVYFVYEFLVDRTVRLVWLSQRMVCQTNRAHFYRNVTLVSASHLRLNSIH